MPRPRRDGDRAINAVDRLPTELDSTEILSRKSLDQWVICHYPGLLGASR